MHTAQDTGGHCTGEQNNKAANTTLEGYDDFIDLLVLDEKLAMIEKSCCLISASLNSCLGSELVVLVLRLVVRVVSQPPALLQELAQRFVLLLLLSTDQMSPVSKIYRYEDVALHVHLTFCVYCLTNT